MNVPDLPITSADRALDHPSQAGGPLAILPRVEVPVAASPGGGLATMPVVIPNAWDLAQAFARRWPLAIGLGVLCASIASVAAWLLVPPASYTAKALLNVSQQQPRWFFQTAETKVDFETYQRTQLTLLRSRLVLNAALRVPEVSELPVIAKQTDELAWLAKQIQAKYEGEILTVSMSGEDPRALPLIVNAVVQSYLDEVVNYEKQSRIERFEKIRELYDNAQRRLTTRRQELKALADQQGAGDIETNRLVHGLALEREQMAIEELMRIEYELRQVEAQMHAAGIAIEEAAPGENPVAAASPVEVSEDQIAQYLGRDEQIATYRRMIQELQEQYTQTMRLAVKANDPTLVAQGRRLADTRAALARYEAQMRPRVIEYLRQQPRDQAVVGVGEELAQQRRMLLELQALAEADVERLGNQSRSINENTFDLEGLRDEIEHIDESAQRLGDEVQALTVEVEAPERVRWIEKADQPQLQPGKRGLMTAAAAGGSFFLTLLAISFLEFQSRRVSNVNTVMAALPLRLVGTLPALPRQSEREESAQHQRGLLMESIEAMRTNLLRIASVEGVRMVMVTSADSGEGKTSLACHLAASLARSERRTLLVDCDLRRPTTHQVFDVLAKPGLCEVLRGEVELADAIQHSSIEGLWVLAAGKGDDTALQMLARRRFQEVFRVLRTSYDFIVVDTPPILPVADALLIGQQVDGAIFSILRNTSRVPRVQSAHDRLAAVGVRILGAVVSGVRGEASYHYPYYDSPVGAGEGT